MTYGPVNGVMTELTYDCRNRLASAGGMRYTYDTENNRMTAETEEYVEEFVTDTASSSLSRVLTVTLRRKDGTDDGNGADRADAALNAGQTFTSMGKVTTLCVYGDGLISEFRGDIRLYHHYNHLGSTMKLTDEEGCTVATYAYGTYGELLSGNAGLTRFLYNGSCGVSTDANGLYYMRQRYYNPETKRFLNQDILTGSIGNSQSLNRYSYVQGNPVSSIDPFGLSPLNMMEGTGLIHGILGLLGCVPGPVGTIANLVDAGVYCFVDHDYGMAALSFVSSVAMGAGSIAVGAGSVVKWAGSGAAKVSLGAAKAAKIARSAEYVRTAATFVTNAAIFAGGGISLWQNSDKLYQKYKAGELKLDWETAAEAGAAVFSAAVCVVSGAGMVKQANKLGKMMKEDNVAGRLKESVGRFGSTKSIGNTTLITHRGTNESIAKKLEQGYLPANYPRPNTAIVRWTEHSKKAVWVSEGKPTLFNRLFSGMVGKRGEASITFEVSSDLIKRPDGIIKRWFGKAQRVIEEDVLIPANAIVKFGGKR